MDIYLGDDFDPYINAISRTNTTTYQDIVTNLCTGSYYLSRAWELTDACGNVARDTQKIWVLDTIAPSFTAPVDITLYPDNNCTVLSDTASIGGVNDEADNCSIGLDATYVDTQTGRLDSAYTITRTWSLSDDCGNSSTAVQIITV